MTLVRNSRGHHYFNNHFVYYFQTMDVVSVAQEMPEQLMKTNICSMLESAERLLVRDKPVIRKSRWVDAACPEKVVSFHCGSVLYNFIVFEIIAVLASSMSYFWICIFSTLKIHNFKICNDLLRTIIDESHNFSYTLFIMKLLKLMMYHSVINSSNPSRVTPHV